MRRFLTILAATVLLLSATVAGARPVPHDVAPRETVRRMVIQEALRSDTVPPSLALAVAQAESDFVADALSPAGARGVMQIMPATGRGEFGVDPDELWNPRLNIQLGVRFLGDLIRRYDGRWDLALSHYNGGSRVGSGASARVIPATRAYVDKVLRLEQRYARDRTVARLVAGAAEANAALAVRAARQAKIDRIDRRVPDRAERRRRFIDLADTALGAPRDRRRPGARIGSADLLELIDTRKARFRAILAGG